MSTILLKTIKFDKSINFITTNDWLNRQTIPLINTNIVGSINLEQKTSLQNIREVFN